MEPAPSCGSIFETTLATMSEFGRLSKIRRQAVAAACRRILLSLPNSDIVASVVSKIEPQLGAGSILLDTTTGDPERSLGLGQRLALQEVHYLDTEIGGS